MITKKNIFTLIRYSLLIFLFISTFQLFGNNNAEYKEIMDQMNFWQKLNTGITFEGTRILNLIFPLSIAHILFLLIGLIVLFPFVTSSINFIKNMLIIYKDLKKIQKTEINNDEEQVEKVNKMLDVLEENNFSLLAIFDLLFSLILGISFLNTIFVKNFELYELFNESDQLLWFSIMSKDKFYILPILSIALIFIVPLIKRFKTNNSNFTEIDKIKNNFGIIIFISSSIFLIPSLFNSSLFCIFLIVNYFIISLKTNYSNLKNKRKGEIYGETQ